MGRTWSHDPHGMRSYNNHHNLGQHLASIAPRTDWKAIAPLFNRGTGDPFTVQPADAGRMATAFTALAPLANPTWSNAVHQLAAAAHAAARNNQPWQWT